jgi:hypothetical protein
LDDELRGMLERKRHTIRLTLHPSSFNHNAMGATLDEEPVLMKITYKMVRA